MLRADKKKIEEKLQPLEKDKKERIFREKINKCYPPLL